MGNTEKMLGQKKEVTLLVYADEIKPEVNIRDEKWAYYGVLLIEEDNLGEAWQLLEDYRYEHAREDQEKYDSEIHYNNLSSPYREKTYIVCDWLKEVAVDNEGIFNFSLLGLNHSELDYSQFGKENSDYMENIENRFFRTLLSGAIKWCFNSADKITLKTVYHDQRSDLTEHEYFPWHSLHKIRSMSSKFYIKNSRIQFLNSDHNHSDGHKGHSQFLQLIDVILGATRQCLDVPSEKEGRIRPAKEEWLPLVERLTDKNRARNPESDFNYYRRASVSFFPKHTICINGEKKGPVYTDRDCLLKQFLNKQQSLDFGDNL